MTLIVIAGRVTVKNQLPTDNKVSTDDGGAKVFCLSDRREIKELDLRVRRTQEILTRIHLLLEKLNETSTRNRYSITPILPSDKE